MAIVQTLATSFKVELLDGVHNFGVGVVRASTAADTFKIALYTTGATLGENTTAYTTAYEAAGTGYSAGGKVLVISQVPTSLGSTTTAWLNFQDVTWSNSSITACGALIYNSSQGNKAVAVLSFGGNKSSSNSNFTVQFPASTYSSAIVRIS